MSAAKHTPGPWYQCGDEVLIDMGDRAHLIATVADWSEDTEPYARLIAAAPELLESLIAIRDASLSGKSLSAAEAAAWDKGWAAIAKATGSAT